MKEIRFMPTFVNTKNVRNFVVLMDGLAIGADEGRLAMVTGRAGLGKTRTAQWYAANHECVYLRVVGPMTRSDTGFLEFLGRELQISGVPRRQGALFAAVIDKLLRRRQPVFVDEMERVGPSLINLVRDLSDTSALPFVLFGEEELDAVMRSNRRTWSRCFRAMEFEPVAPPDIIFYLKESASMTLDPGIAAYMHEMSAGDWRLIKGASLSLVQQANANGNPNITRQMVTNAFNIGLSGRKRS